MASKYRLSSMVPNIYEKSELNDITHNITDKSLLEYEQQLVNELNNHHRSIENTRQPI